MSQEALASRDAGTLSTAKEGEIDFKLKRRVKCKSRRAVRTRAGEPESKGPSFMPRQVQGGSVKKLPQSLVRTQPLAPDPVTMTTGVS